NGNELFVTSINNYKEKIKNLAALLQNNKPDSAKNNLPKKPKPLIFSNDSFFVVSLSQMAGQKFLGSAGNNEAIEKIIEPYKNNHSAFIIDLRTIFAFAVQPMLKNKSEEEAKQAAEVLGRFARVVSYGGEHENNFLSRAIKLR